MALGEVPVKAEAVMSLGIHIPALYMDASPQCLTVGRLINASLVGQAQRHRHLSGPS